MVSGVVQACMGEGAERGVKQYSLKKIRTLEASSSNTLSSMPRLVGEYLGKDI